MLLYIGYGLAALCALFYSVLAYRRRGRLSIFAGNMFVSAAAVNITYLLRIHADTHTAASVTGSFYFVCLDLLVLAIFQYSVEFCVTRHSLSKEKRYIYLISSVVTAADCILLLSNILLGFVMDYRYEVYSIYVIKYMYVPGRIFYAHLVLVYLLAVGSAAAFLVKSVRVPAMYRGRYSNSLAVLLVLLLFTVGYMTGRIRIGADLSVIACGLLCPAVYRNTFDYTSKGMLNTTRKMILEYMSTPMILFDYDGYVADTNRDIRNLFPALNNQDQKLTMMDFMQIAAFKELQDTVTDQVFEWQNPGDIGDKVYQCDFRCLKDEKGRGIGHLLIMRSAVIERDSLTRLFTKQSFYENVVKLMKQQAYPITVVVCNTNGIGLINDVYGWAKGNETLRNTAKLLQDKLPKTAVIGRLEGGDMAAALPQAEQEYAVRLFQNIKDQYSVGDDLGIDADLEYGISVIRGDGTTVEDAVKEAIESMRTKKMMNESSQKSSLLDSLTQTLTESDYETEEHVERTKDMAVRLGKALHLSDAELGKLALLAVLHDIGKIAIPHSILLKPGKLTDEEWEIMKSHTEKGYRIASASKELQPIADYILHHHERWDGTGYPDGLAGQEIPLLSRIITVVDSHDVMVHDRPYHKAMCYEDAVEELKRCAGTQFDPDIVEVFLRVLEKDRHSGT